ncbi:hypothetical protein M1146_04820 [Patescibacteria group bacterium]|nr:hypothetical protein [Patescibacteria group bacterium]
MSGEEVVVKEKKSKLHRLSRTISKDLLGMNKDETNKVEATEQKLSKSSSSRSRALSESQLDETLANEKKEKEESRSLSARLSGAFGNILHLSGSGDTAIVEQVLSFLLLR